MFVSEAQDKLAHLSLLRSAIHADQRDWKKATKPLRDMSEPQKKSSAAFRQDFGSKI